MKTNSLKNILVALTVVALGSSQAGLDRETLLSWMPKNTEMVQLPRCSTKQRSMDFVRNTIACSMVANGVISKNNNLTRVALGAAGSLIGSLALHSAYEAQAGPSALDPAAAKIATNDSSSSGSSEEELKRMGQMQAIFVWSLYFAGQNVPQIIDFAKDSTYRKNILKAIWDTLFANRDRSEWAAIFVRNFGPLFMHYTPIGQAWSNILPQLPALEAQSKKTA